MRPVRTALVFASGVAVYALVAACGGNGNDTGDSSPTGHGGDSSTSTGARTTPSSGGAGATGGGGRAAGGSSGDGGTGTGAASGTGGNGATSTSSSSAASTSSATGPGGSGGGGGGFVGVRLLPEYEAAIDGAKDAQFALVPWSTTTQGNPNYFRPERYFWDAERQEECVYDVAADGKLRCLPADAGGSPIVYADSACTRHAIAVAAAPPGCSIVPPKYAKKIDYPQNQTCSTEGWYPTHVYPVGAFLGPNIACYSIQNGTCRSAGCGINSPSGYAAYAVGNEISAAKFVAGTKTHD